MGTLVFKVGVKVLSSLILALVVDFEVPTKDIEEELEDEEEAGETEVEGEAEERPTEGHPPAEVRTVEGSQLEESPKVAFLVWCWHLNINAEVVKEEREEDAEVEEGCGWFLAQSLLWWPSERSSKVAF